MREEIAVPAGRARRCPPPRPSAVGVRVGGAKRGLGACRLGLGACRLGLGACGMAVLLCAAAPASAQTGRRVDLAAELTAMRDALPSLRSAIEAGDVASARTQAVRLYLDRYETVEALWGSSPSNPGEPAGGSTPPNAGEPASGVRGPGPDRAGTAAEPGEAGRAIPLGQAVTRGELAFHALMSASTASDASDALVRLERALVAIERAAAAAPAASLIVEIGAPAVSMPDPPEAAVPARSPEVRAISEQLDVAKSAYADGRRADALAAVETAYLEGIELIEARLPAGIVRPIESLVHLQLRPTLARGDADATPLFTALDAELARADEHLARGGSAWFGAANAFVILFREGLEAVLLIGALLAYLGAVRAERRYHRRVWIGVGLGVLASFATFVLALTIIPVTGASRELIEGITALVAVAVLLYVSNWLFQKTYIHDWKAYLKDRLGRAVDNGSGWAMAGLAFAAVFREGFETVLFYQALLFDAGTLPVIAGFAPAALLVVAIGFGIVKLGLKLPLKRVFAITNGVLLYLAFVFIGKGIYNLQEAGAFSPRPIQWLPDSELLRQAIGFYPLAETLLAQTAFLALLTGTYLLYRFRIAPAQAIARGAAATRR